MAKEIKVGVVGAGQMAQRVHLPALAAIDGAKVVAVCDLVEERVAEAAEAFGIPRTYTLQRAMLETEELDAAFVLVEPGSHFHVVRLCLEAGLPTFMEKPPGISSYQAWSLKRLADENGVGLQVGFNRRFIPLVVRVLEIVRERTRVTEIDGRFMKEGPAAFDSGSVSALSSDTIHCVDLVRWIAGSEPDTVATVTGRDNDDVTNRWSSVIRFANGTTGTVRANYQTGGRVHTFEIHGPGASAYVDLGFGGFGCSARILLGSGSQGYSLAATGSGNLEILDLDGMEIAGSDHFAWYYGFYQEDESFIRTVQSGDRPACDIGEAALSFDLVDRIQAAGR